MIQNKANITTVCKKLNVIKLKYIFTFVNRFPLGDAN